MRTMSRRTVRGMLLGLVVFAGAQVGDAQTTPKPAAYVTMAPIEEYLMGDRQAEIALARSAAPAGVSTDATVLVLTRQGYETAATGTNGFVCLVDRTWQAPFQIEDFWNPKVRAPVCLNPQAARSVVPVTLERTRIALAGHSKQEMKARILAAYEKKVLPYPELGAMSYMMGKDQYLDRTSKQGMPHLMFYLSSAVTDKDWGANLKDSPIIGGNKPDEPMRVLIVPVPTWSDGSPGPAHH